ncbi:MAG TPA: protein-disulfide reductase DsbD domain-containing protein [Sphingomicrobium sp.]|nr:protein-disulfide reductase DsbD domain-containing protein [Sphingomicrobium sp.]
MRRFLLLLFLLLSPVALEARGIEPELVAEGPAPAGGDVELAIHMRPEPGWHGYWQNPGDAGLPMDIEWKLPNGYAAGPLRYPVPTPLTIGGIMNFVFERDYAVLVRLKVPAGAKGVVPIRADAHWLACTDKVCVPERGELALDLPVGTGTPERAQFDQWRRQLAQPIATLGHFAVDRDKLEVAIPLPATIELSEPYLFPITENVVDYEAPQAFRRAGDWLVADLHMKNPPTQFAGVLASKGGRGLAFRAVKGPVPEGGSPIDGVGWNAMLWAVLGALAGGILLNLMPCVFPILALKALHLSRAGGEAREARADALLYSAGAIVGTGALGLILLAIRAAGTQAGWAFQLQDPRTILLLLLLAVAITANLLGLFELPVLGGRTQPAGSFGTGALAAFVATPCAGPFLGAALGTALLLPAAGAVVVFAALGLGLALPFLLVAFIPSLRTRMPKPGRWMDRLKRFLAIPMGASAVAALWLLYRLAGTAALLVGLSGSAIVLLALLFAGRQQRSGRGAFWALPAVLGFAVLLLFVVPTPTVLGTPVSAGGNAWNEARLSKALRDHRPVFVYFTADWCLTCKVNEAAAIERSEVQDAFKKAGVIVLVGDWTNGDPAITRFLESRGRAGVPYYLWYGSEGSPEELPQVLTPAMLIERARQVRR